MSGRAKKHDSGNASNRPKNSHATQSKQITTNPSPKTVLKVDCSPQVNNNKNTKTKKNQESDPLHNVNLENNTQKNRCTITIPNSPTSPNDPQHKRHSPSILNGLGVPYGMVYGPEHGWTSVDENPQIEERKPINRKKQELLKFDNRFNEERNAIYKAESNHNRNFPNLGKAKDHFHDIRKFATTKVEKSQNKYSKIFTKKVPEVVVPHVEKKDDAHLAPPTKLKLEKYRELEIRVDDDFDFESLSNKKHPFLNQCQRDYSEIENIDGIEDAKDKSPTAAPKLQEILETYDTGKSNESGSHDDNSDDDTSSTISESLDFGDDAISALSIEKLQEVQGRTLFTPFSFSDLEYESNGSPRMKRAGRGHQRYLSVNNFRPGSAGTISERSAKKHTRTKTVALSEFSTSPPKIKVIYTEKEPITVQPYDSPINNFEEEQSPESPLQLRRHSIATNNMPPGLIKCLDNGKVISLNPEINSKTSNLLELRSPKTYTEEIIFDDD